MQGGIFIDGKLPKSKAEVKRAVADPGQHYVTFYDTSAFNPHGSCDVRALPAGRHTFVGPDPFNKRNFYGTIEVVNGKVKVS